MYVIMLIYDRAHNDGITLFHFEGCKYAQEQK